MSSLGRLIVLPTNTRIGQIASSSRRWRAATRASQSARSESFTGVIALSGTCSELAPANLLKLDAGAPPRLLRDEPLPCWRSRRAAAARHWCSEATSMAAPSMRAQGTVI